MLMMREVQTEIDLRNTTSMKASLAAAKVIPSENLDDFETLKTYSRNQLVDAITKVLPVQSVAMRRIEEYIVKCK